jgi:tetratricopeptide (TPR) repeat protein
MGFEEAIKDFEDAIKYDKNNAETYYNRGNVYLHR